MGEVIMGRSLVTGLRLTLPVALLVALLTAVFVTRSEIQRGFEPDRYEFVVALLVEASGVVVELVILVLFIDYFAKAAQRRLSATAKAHLEHHYDRVLFPVFRDVRDLLNLREKWEHAHGSSSATGGQSAVTTTTDHYLDAELDRSLEEMRKDLGAYRANFPEVTTRLVHLLPPDDAVCLLRVVEPIETFEWPDENSPLRARVTGSAKYQRLYPSLMSFAAWLALPLWDFEERFRLGRTSESQTFDSPEAAIEFAASHRPYSRLRLGNPDVRHQRAWGLFIQTSLAENFLNEMIAWSRRSGSSGLVAHGLGGGRAERLLRQRVASQKRYAVVFRAVSFCRRLLRSPHG